MRIDVQDGRITAIFEGNHPTPPSGARVERLPGCVIAPALVNAHSHAFQRAFRGRVQSRVAERDDFWSWRAAMYATANALPPEGVEAIARLAFLEMAEAGVGVVGEFHYLHHQPGGARYADPDELARRVIAAAREVGLRITLLRTAYGAAGMGVPLRADQARFGDRDPGEVLAAVERLGQHSDPHVRVGLAPHSVRAVPSAWLPDLADFAGVVHAHVSEQPAENEASEAALGRSPTAAFAEAGLVSARFTAVHLTHPRPGDVERLVQADASVCVCPTTELDLGDGLLPVEAHALRLCVGTDSQATIDVLGEARLIEGHARAQLGRRAVRVDANGECAPPLLETATQAGRRALGWDEARVEVGAVADLVAFDLDRPAAWGVPPLEAVAFGARPEWTRALWVGGREVIRDGRHPGRESILAAARPWLGR